ncbi:MAG TPA: hypothetical protein VHL11_13770 [Phototrophicaceae bacterium]|nr:hypothetical protein [Phototrophicaceae bacterium]
MSKQHRLFRIALVICLLLITGSIILTLVAFMLPYTLNTGRLLPSEPTLSPAMLETYWDNPPPLPDGFSRVQNKVKNGELFCTEFGAVTKLPGEEGLETYFKLQRSIALNIDGIYHNDLTLYDLLVAFNSPDGIVHGVLSLCLQIENLSLGLHSAKMEFTDIYGKVYSYTWAFKVVPSE